jgi:peptide chain release factor subunit 3
VSATPTEGEVGQEDSPGPSPSTPTYRRPSPAPQAGLQDAGRDADAVKKEQTADVDEATLQEVYGKEHLNIIFIGHVDSGKSTLGGSILCTTGMIDQRTLEKYKKDAKDMGKEAVGCSWRFENNTD